jgi:4-methyl-5(b-hydroxyethyl)-thiazole monophosphate biosynthesis
MSKTVLIVLATGFEEIEAITPIDVLRRAGLEVTIAGVGGREITGSHGITVVTDTTIEEVEKLPDAIVLPGGMPGAENLAKSDTLREILKRMNDEGRSIGAICAAPAVALAPTGILDGRMATCYPGFESRFGGSIVFSGERVVADGNVMTSRGPGTAFEFALALAERLAGGEVRKALTEGMLVKA